MGAAAYHRGSRSLSRQMDAEQRPVEFVLMDELNALPKYPDAGRPFGPVQVFYAPQGVWWIQCPTTGYGFWYRSLRELVKRWQITIIGYQGGVWTAIPTP